MKKAIIFSLEFTFESLDPNITDEQFRSLIKDNFLNVKKEIRKMEGKTDDTSTIKLETVGYSDYRVKNLGGKKKSHHDTNPRYKQY